MAKRLKGPEMKRCLERTPGLPRSHRLGGFDTRRFGLVRLRLTNVFFVDIINFSLARFPRFDYIAEI